MEKATKYHPQNYCIECRKLINRQQYEKHRDARLAKYGDYKSSEQGRVVAGRSSKNAYRSEPDKAIARSRLRYAVKTGKILKLPCQECLEPEVEFHHTNGYDEANWYVGLWLCRFHHRKTHGFFTKTYIKIKEAELNRTEGEK